MRVYLSGSAGARNGLGCEGMNMNSTNSYKLKSVRNRWLLSMTTMMTKYEARLRISDYPRVAEWMVRTSHPVRFRLGLDQIRTSLRTALRQ